VTGSDDGGFKPHPGDPWHPDWSEDAESGDEVETQPDALVSESEQPKKKKGKRRGRRGRRSDQVAAESELDSASFEPVADGDGESSDEGAAESELDGASFEPVADGEGGPSGVELPAVGEEAIDPAPETEEEKPPRSFVEDENAPAPAWTSDQEPDPDKLLPVEQPSWVGQTTEMTAGIEAVGFEPTALPEAEVNPDDAPELPASEEEPGLIGEYGVAGPEAFEALEEDDAPTGELDDWGAFMEGSQPPAGATGLGDVGDAIPPSDRAPVDGEVEDWTAPAPKKRRGLFRRGKRDRVEDGFVGSAAGDDAAAVEPTVPSQFGVPEELPAGADAFDEWVESEPDQRRSLIGSGDLERAEDFVAGPVEDVAPDVGGDDGSVGAVGRQPAREPQADLDEQPDLFGGSPDVGSTPEPSTEQSESVAELDAEPVEQDDAGVDDGQDWEGDPGRVPAAWFAEIDEDQVVPPTSGELPEKEWSEAVDGSRQDGQGQVEPTDLFDVDPIDDGPQPGVVEQQPQVTAPVPEGYEPWHQAVTDAVEVGAAADQYADDGTYEYDQPALQASEGLPAEGLPAGFEPFPGEAGMEQFELPEETLRDELSSGGLEPGWVTDQVDPGQMPTEEMDSAFGVGEEFNDQIYAAGGTIEHRDLAAAIAEAGEEDAQWQAISAAMPGVETGVVGFEDVAHLGTGAEYVATTRSDLGLRVVTGVVLVSLLFGSLFIADVAFVIFVSLVVMLGLSEFYGSLRRSGYLPLGIFGIIGGVGTLSAVWFHGPLAIPVGVLLTSMVTFFFYAFSQTRRDALSNAGLTVLGVGWIIGPVAFVIPIVRAPEHVTLVFAIVAVTAATDVGAFSFGRAWGKSPLAPVLSPNKTAEGLAGGVMLALAVAAAIGFFELGPFDLRSGLALGTIVAFLAPIGDLAESMVKRSLGIKDMGSILPGHGGVLDRIDAFLFVIPAAWVFYEAIGFLG